MSIPTGTTMPAKTLKSPGPVGRMLLPPWGSSDWHARWATSDCGELGSIRSPGCMTSESGKFGMPWERIQAANASFPGVRVAEAVGLARGQRDRPPGRQEDAPVITAQPGCRQGWRAAHGDSRGRGPRGPRPRSGVQDAHAVWAARNCDEFGSMPGGRLNWKPWPTIGSGKFGTPCDRMQAAYWSPASSSATGGPPPVPWGSSASHARWATRYPGESVSIPAGSCPRGRGSSTPHASACTGRTPTRRSCRLRMRPSWSSPAPRPARWTRWSRPRQGRPTPPWPAPIFEGGSRSWCPVLLRCPLRGPAGQL
jgi:hypothetical protein